MERFRRFFYNNKNQIYKAIGIIAVILITIQILNQLAKKELEKRREETETIDYGKDISAVTQEKKNKYEYSSQKEIMEEFVNYCNEENYEEAYNLLTDDCKETLYPNIDIFIENYCKTNFETKKTCSFQTWSENTYLVEIRENIMATGNYVEGQSLQDYFTIVNNKININGFIQKIQYESTQTEGDIRIKLNSLDIYKDYVIANITFINQTQHNAMLNTLEKDENIEITDENGIKYFSIISELTENDVTAIPGEVKQIPIRFFITKRKDQEFKEMSFKNIVENTETNTLKKAKIQL